MKCIHCVFWTFMSTNLVKGQCGTNLFEYMAFWSCSMYSNRFLSQPDLCKICAHKNPKLRVAKLHFDLHSRSVKIDLQFKMTNLCIVYLFFSWEKESIFTGR